MNAKLMQHSIIDNSQPVVRNAFELITQDPVRFNMLALKSKLVMVLVDMIKRENWSQVEAAENLGVSQPRISNLFSGKLDKFSVDKLLEMIVTLGYKLDMSYRPHNSEAPLEMKLTKAML